MNEMYEDFTNTITSVTNKFAPQKVKKCIPKPVPYMNKSLKQDVYRKQMLFNKFQKHKTSKNWENFRRQRNLVTKLKQKSANQYFLERCLQAVKYGILVYSQTILSNKGTHFQNDTILLKKVNL